jgi:hypothetical protein
MTEPTTHSNTAEMEVNPLKLVLEKGKSLFSYQKFVNLPGIFDALYR